MKRSHSGLRVAVLDRGLPAGTGVVAALVGVRAVGHQDASAHPEVDREHRPWGARPPGAGRLAPHQLAAPVGDRQSAAHERVAQLPRLVRPALVAVAVVDVGDPPVETGPFDDGASGLDLGQFRHVRSLARRAVRLPRRSGVPSMAGRRVRVVTATQQVAADERAGRRGQFAVIAVFFVHGLLFASWTAHIPHIKADLGFSNGTLGIALLGTPIGSVTAIAIAARLVPRLGSRRVVQVSLVGYCLTGPLIGLSGSLIGLMLALFVWGLFQGVLDVSMNTQAIAVEGARRRPLMNGIHAWWSIGAFAGAGAGTLGVALGVELSVQLLVLGIPVMVIAGLLTARMLTDRVGTDAGDEPVTASGRRLSRGMLALGGIAFASMLCEGAAADWSSVYLRDSLGGGAAAAGLGYTAFALAMFTVRAGGDRLITRLPVHRLLPLLSAVAALAFLTALLVGDVAVGVAGFFVLGLGLGAVVPSAFSAAGRLPGNPPRRRGRRRLGARLGRLRLRPPVDRPAGEPELTPGGAGSPAVARRGGGLRLRARHRAASGSEQQRVRVGHVHRAGHHGREHERAGPDPQRDHDRRGRHEGHEGHDRRGHELQCRQRSARRHPPPHIGTLARGDPAEPQHRGQALGRSAPAHTVGGGTGSRAEDQGRQLPQDLLRASGRRTGQRRGDPVVTDDLADERGRSRRDRPRPGPGGRQRRGERHEGPDGAGVRDRTREPAALQVPGHDPGGEAGRRGGHER